MFDMSSLYKMARKTKAAIGIGVAGSSDAVSNSLERAGSEGFARVEVFDTPDDLISSLKDGKIHFKVCRDFYDGLKMSVEEAVDLMEQCTIVNMVGQNIVKKAIEKGLVHPDAVLDISGVPHAQIVKL